MARDSVPIPSSPAAEPAGPPGRAGRRSSVVRSSLDLVFSYSRSQQRFFAGLPSAPSFVDYQWGDGDEGADGDSNYDDSMREWDPEAGPSNHGACESCDEDVNEDENSVADASAFFPDDLDRPSLDRGDRSTPLSPVHEEARLADIPLPSKRGGIMSFFSTTPTAHSAVANLSSSVKSGNSGGSSGGSETPRAAPRRLPEEGALSRSWASNQQRGLGLTAANSQSLSPTKRAREPSAATERTPLLRTGRPAQSVKRNWRPDTLSPSPNRRLSVGRRGSVASRRVSIAPFPAKGDSGNGQTLFNSVAVLIGVGLLSMPLAFSYAGWIGGTILLLGFSYLTCHTAKLLARLVIADPTLHGYTDIGRKAFGSWVGGLINLLFCVELFAFGVAMVVLFGDSLSTITPNWSAEQCMAFGFFLILPTVFMPLKLLSVPSVFSTLATVLLVLIILFDGFWKTKAPGSILDPMPTHWGPELKGMNWLGGIGLILAGFGGHGVMPSIARDMKHPEAVDRIFNMAFTVAATISMLAGGAGYLMMGDDVSDEITRDMMKPKYGYPPVLNHIAIWMIIITPLTKFGLCSRPLHIAIEGLLNLAPAAAVVSVPPPRVNRRISVSQAIGSAISQSLSNVATSDYAITDDSGIEFPKAPEPAAEPVDALKEGSKGVLRMVSRTVLTAGCVVAAIILPGFEKVMAFLGSFSAFLICIILPITFYLRLGPRITKDRHGAAAVVAAGVQHSFHIVVLIVSVILMCLGTVWAFLPSSGRQHGD